MLIKKSPGVKPVTTQPQTPTTDEPDPMATTEMYVQVSMVQPNAALLLIFGSEDIREFQVNLLNDRGGDQNFTSMNDMRPTVVLLQPLVSG